jgi:hypothetical protein
MGTKGCCVLKVTNVAAAFIGLAAIYGASTAYSEELITPRPDTHTEISRTITRMCVNAEDAYELATQDAKEGKMDWQGKNRDRKARGRPITSHFLPRARRIRGYAR